MIEAMKQALGALEDFVDVIKYDNEQDDIGRRACCDVLSYNPHSESCKAKQAITAIKEAIREHAMYEVQRLGQDIEQEPVCPDCKAKVLYECVACSSNNYPPQRTWVGLTDDEISALSKGHIVRSTYARAIEAKLKQKNGFAEEKST
jgi:hypothetical protein